VDHDSSLTQASSNSYATKTAAAPLTATQSDLH